MQFFKLNSFDIQTLLQPAKDALEKKRNDLLKIMESEKQKLKPCVEAEIEKLDGRKETFEPSYLQLLKIYYLIPVLMLIPFFYSQTKIPSSEKKYFVGFLLFAQLFLLVYVLLVDSMREIRGISFTTLVDEINKVV